MICIGKSFTRHIQTHEADAPAQIFPQTDKRLGRREMANYHKVRLSKLRFDINFQRASADTGERNFNHTLMRGLSHFLWRAESDETRQAILQGFLRLALDSRFRAASANPTREFTILSDDRFSAHFRRGGFLRAHNGCDYKRVASIVQGL